MTRIATLLLLMLHSVTGCSQTPPTSTQNSGVTAANEQAVEILMKVRAAKTEAEHLAAPAALQPLAKAGNAEAQFLLGWYGEMGPGTIDYIEASRWYSKAADQGHVLAKARLARFLRIGIGMLPDEQRGIKQIAEILPEVRRKADAGDRIAQYLFASCLATGTGASQDVKAATSFAQKSAEQGLPCGQRYYALALLDGVVTPAQQAEAVKWLRSAADQGDPESLCLMARLTTTGELGVERNEEVSVVLLKKSVEMKYPEGQRQYGLVVLFGYSGVNRDEKEAARLFEAAANPNRLTNSVGMSMTRINSGPFQLGMVPAKEFKEKLNGLAIADDAAMYATASPPEQKCEIDHDFYIGTHEVTIGNFRRFVRDAKYQTEAERDGKGGTGLLPNGEFGDHPKFTWNNYGFVVSDEHAVANVSWNDAVAFCDWLSKKEGRKYRLPTEQEWEKSAKGGISSPFCVGQDFDVALHRYGNVADAELKKRLPGVSWTLEGNDGQPFLGSVGKYYPNPYGLYDIYGNVIEWCSTEFKVYEPFRGLIDIKWPEPAGEQRHVHRGGNWFNRPSLGSSVSRSGSPPTFRNSLTGFRVVMETKR